MAEQQSNMHKGAGKITQWLKGLATKSDNPGPHHEKIELTVRSCPLSFS